MCIVVHSDKYVVCSVQLKNTLLIGQPVTLNHKQKPGRAACFYHTTDCSFKNFVCLFICMFVGRHKKKFEANILKMTKTLHPSHSKSSRQRLRHRIVTNQTIPPFNKMNFGYPKISSNYRAQAQDILSLGVPPSPMVVRKVFFWFFWPTSKVGVP